MMNGERTNEYHSVFQFHDRDFSRLANPVQFKNGIPGYHYFLLKRLLSEFITV